MPIIASDTSPLSLLLRLKQEIVLERLFDSVLVPPEVMSELSHPKSPPEVRAFAASPPNWVAVRSASRSVPYPKLDPGEIAAIALAIELNIPLMIDELKGRKIASEQGIEVIGAVGILERAAIAGLIADPAAVFRQIRVVNFHIAQHYLDDSLARIHKALSVGNDLTEPSGN